MIKGSRARADDFKGVNSDAEEIGHAIFAVSPENRAKLCNSTLTALVKQAKALYARGQDAKVQQRSCQHLLRVMHRHDIAASPLWVDQTKAIVTADAKKAEDARLSMEKARYKQKRRRDFERSEAEQEAGGSKSATPVSAAPWYSSFDVKEDEDENE